MAEGESPDQGIGTLLRQLAADGRAYAEAEAAYWRSEARVRGRIAARGGVALLVAITLAQGALIALLVALVLALTPALGALGAALVVVGVALAIAGLAGWLAYRWFREAVATDDKGPGA